jgi:carbamoyltransferase
MLLNTSFNVRGEPIVCSPDDAINTFLNTYLDVLVIGPFVIKRSEQSSNIDNLIGKRKFHAD